MRGRSPFYHRSPITDPAHFFGRERELEVLLARTVGAAKPQCVSVVGNRRVGKSSLFRQLVDHRGPRAAHEGEPVAWIYHDLEGSAKLTVDRFFRSLSRRLEKRLKRLDLALPPAPEHADEESEEAFSERIEDLSDEGVRVVLCLDEFDCVTLNEHFDADFFGRLRYLANSFQLAYVTSSFNDLTELCHQDEIRQSPFFNVFSTLNLGLLTDEESRELLVEESTRAGSPLSADELSLVDELAGNHPFHLQQAADAAWSVERAGDRRGIRARFIDEAAPHFRYAVEHLPPAAAEALGRAARGELSGGDTSPGCELLHRRGLVVVSGSRLTPFSAAFRDWLHDHPEALTPEASTSEAVTVDGRQPAGATLADRTTRPGEPRRPGQAPVVGDTLAGRYDLQEAVGRGGFGVVFRARDDLLGRDVAVKCIGWRHHPSASPEHLRARFLQEARAGAGISHPNVVAVHDLVEDAGDLFAIMEYFPGRSLRSLLDEHRRLPVADVLELGVQAARGLQAAHDLQVVHRDVKPENLLVDEEAHLKIVDFGIAFVVSQLRLTTDGATPLTPRYSSPEQVDGAAATPVADVFSLGCVLFEMLTGELLFDGESTSAVIAQIVGGRAADRLELLTGWPERLQATVRRCLEQDPAARWPSCAALARELGKQAETGDG